MRSLLLVLVLLAVGCVGPAAFVLPPTEPAPPTPEVAVAPEVTSTPEVAATQFALDLYGSLGQNKGNVFFSPSSIREAFAMAHAGARGETASEMASVLRLPNDATQARRAMAGLRPSVAPSSGVQLRQTASLWGQRGFGFRRSFLSFLGDGYGAELHEVDFQSGDSARKSINSWVESQTDNRIKDLFGPGTLSPVTRLALVSAVHFKADWARPFTKESTRVEDFSVSPERKVPVKLMHQIERFGYTEIPDGQMLEMPYAGNELALLAVLPDFVGGLPALEKSLTAEKLTTWASQLQPRKVAVTFPRFQMTGELELPKHLAGLGMKRAFDPSQADFSGMNDGPDKLYLRTAVHKAWIELNELGSEAAAATGVQSDLMLAPPTVRAEPVFVFRADHPFLFAIRDLRTGAILFLGRYAQP